MIGRGLGYICVAGASIALVDRQWVDLTIVSLFVLCVLVICGATVVDTLFDDK